MKQNVTIKLQPLEKTIEVNQGTPLIDVLHEYGVEFPCGGKGTCGACKVKLLEGELKAGSGQKRKLEKLNSGEDEIKLTPKVSLTQQDIREFQLAKAAIAAGIHILFKQLNISNDDIKNVFIADGFGNFLNIKNVIRTGLIECEVEKIAKLGNTALIGAKMFLFENEDFTQKILTKTTHVNLEGDGTFQDVYIDKMMLV